MSNIILPNKCIETINEQPKNKLPGAARLWPVLAWIVFSRRCEKDRSEGKKVKTHIYCNKYIMCTRIHFLHKNNNKKKNIYIYIYIYKDQNTD